MIRKSVFSGIFFGLGITSLLTYPTFYIFLDRVIPGVGRPLERILGAYPELAPFRVQLALLVIMALTGLAMLLAALCGVASAWRSRVNTIQTGIQSGMVSGLFCALTVYILLVAPTTAILAGGDLLVYPFQVGTQAVYPRSLMVPFARFVLVGEVKYFFLSLLGGLLIGGLEGAFAGLLRRGQPSEPRPDSLLDSLNNKNGYRDWFKNYEEPVLSGLVTGVLGGLILVLGDYLNKSTVVNSSDPTTQWLDNVFQEAFQASPFSEVHIVLLPLLVTLSFLVVIGMGGVAAFLPKNPPGFLRSRVFAATVSGTMIGLMIAFATTGYVRFGIVLLPRLLIYDWQSLDAETQRFLQMLLTPQARVVMMYLVPLPVIGVMAAGYTLWGTIQGLVYSLIFALFKLRPVDQASALRREMNQNRDLFLPRLYGLFQRDRQAIQVLEHLAFDLKKGDPARARVVAAYHTMATRPDLASRAFDEISQVLDVQAGCKLCSEIQALHGLLAQGLRARTLAQITVLLPVPEQHTSSLLPPLVKAGDFLSRPLIELKKVERVDDLSSKIIFLSNALENLRQARIFTETSAKENFATLLPEILVMRLLLDQWEAVVLATIRDIQGRAELTAVLKTNKVSSAESLPLTVVLSNHGLNVAERIRLQVDGFSEAYTVLEGGMQTVDILAPQDSRELTFTIRPAQRGRMRVCWKVTYADAVKDQDVLEFADQIEFVEVEKPFQRIFPIPYVTGTPLQTEEMFVGRQDVFAFVREHLFGTYQNNVIVLHGQRRTGKSSILYRLGRELADSHYTVLIDMQGKAARGEVDFLYSIADDIVYALENKGIAVELPARKDFEESPEFFFRNRFLRGVYQALGDRNLLLMFDEFEELQKRVEDGKLSADIFPFLRNLMQHERRLDFIFAGTHKLEELAAEYWSILFNIAIYKRITFLDLPEVERLVRQPVLPYGMEYDALAIERIYQVTSGHPYFTQVVCHELVGFHNETQRSYITVTDVETCVGRILERGEAHFKYIWAESGVAQRLALLALAECLETDESATLEDLLAILARRGRPQTPDDLLDSLTNLEARDILMRSGPRSTLYRFRVDLIRRWVYAARPAYEKVL